MPSVVHEPSPRLFLLCGLPFSGKSTMSRALRDQFGIEHVEVDRYVDAAVGGQRKLEESDWLPAYRLAIEEIKRHLRERKSVVFDAVGHHRRHRRRMDRLAHSMGARMTVIFLDVSVDEARVRLLANRANPVRQDVPDEGFAMIAEQLEPPEPDEGALIYRPSEPLTLWLEREIRPIVEQTR